MEILWPSSIEVMNLHYLDKWVSANVDINNFNSSVVDVKKIFRRKSIKSGFLLKLTTSNKKQ